eukprot:COSAG02_NODE_58542_length_277_cov_0.578652_1_plen_30_part_10
MAELKETNLTGSRLNNFRFEWLLVFGKGGV